MQYEYHSEPTDNKSENVDLPLVSNYTSELPALGITDPEQTIPNNSADDCILLDDEILSFLGDPPNKGKKLGPKIQTEIAIRWEQAAISGVNKDLRKEFYDKYLTPENCTLIDPPALNLEIKAAISESLLKKDSAIQNKQKEVSAAISCIGLAIQRALCYDKKDTEMIKLLIDAGRIMCDIQHTESRLRRGYICSCIKKEVKDHLNDTKIDNFLFGEKLADTLKAAKTINKSGSEIKISTTSRPHMKYNMATRSLNSRGPAPGSRLPFAGRPEKTASASTLASAQPRRRVPPPPPRPRQRQRAPRRQ